MTFTETILHWYAAHRRELPWRNISDPYRIWVSEIILQQTRVAQGYDYYLRFVNAFPTVEALALASEDEVLRLWQGLGYYSRARNLHAAARQVVAQGHFPTDYAGVRALKGVGLYRRCHLLVCLRVTLGSGGRQCLPRTQPLFRRGRTD